MMYGGVYFFHPKYNQQLCLAKKNIPINRTFPKLKK